VLRHGMKPVAIGLIAGLLGALWIGRLLSSLFFSVTLQDPLTISLVVLIELGVTIAACWIPAWRASRVDPLIALRSE
jgi:putative ABC transport system permease protein